MKIQSSPRYPGWAITYESGTVSMRKNGHHIRITQAGPRTWTACVVADDLTRLYVGSPAQAVAWCESR